MIETNSNDKCINNLKENLDDLSKILPERIKIVKNDIKAWEAYVVKVEEMQEWISGKKEIMELEKPKDRESREEQKILLEVSEECV